jgi:hypothetical protein
MGWLKEEQGAFDRSIRNRLQTFNTVHRDNEAEGGRERSIEGAFPRGKESKEGVRRKEPVLCPRHSQ